MHFVGGFSQDFWELKKNVASLPMLSNCLWDSLYEEEYINNSICLGRQSFWNCTKKRDYVLNISNKALLIGNQIERVSQWVIGEIKSLKGFVM